MNAHGRASLSSESSGAPICATSHRRVSTPRVRSWQLPTGGTMPLSALLKNRDAPCASAGAGNAPDGEERRMAEFGITYNGRHFEYDTYRYDQLADAVNYARLQRSK